MPAHYMLRRCLSLWRAEQDIAEAAAYCTAHDIDEVIWKIDVEHFNHGLTPLDTIRPYLPWLDEGPMDQVWQAWNVSYRDVIILDDENRPVAVYNLTLHDLSNAANYAELKAILLNAANSL